MDKDVVSSGLRSKYSESGVFWMPQHIHELTIIMLNFQQNANYIGTIHQVWSWFAVVSAYNTTETFHSI